MMPRYPKWTAVINMEPEFVTTEEQYRSFLLAVESLAARDPDPVSTEGERLLALAKLVEDYEKQRHWARA